jgi:membrane-bound metal-dependent hydrolase YbcI (DUF457 family)
LRAIAAEICNTLTDDAGQPAPGRDAMFLGHFAVGLAAKRAAPRTSLGWLVAACQLLDLLWPVFLLAGLEQVRIDPGNTPVTPLSFDRYPISHSLLMACVWGAALAALYFWRTRRGRAAVVIALVVVSHWVLDWITHRPDLPLAPWSPVTVGLGLWYSRVGTAILESLMYIGGLWLYASMTRPRDRVGRWGFAAFAGLLAIIYAANLSGPPPPGVEAVAVSALALWLLPPWAAWFDRHRRVEPEDPGPAAPAREV